MKILAIKNLSFLPLAMVLSVSLPSHAESLNAKIRGEAIAKAWVDWAKEQNATRSAIAVSYKGELVAKGEIGLTINDPAPIASLSKTITGVCLAQLVGQGQLSYDQTIGDIVPQLKANVPLGALAAHASGFATDITQTRLSEFKDFKQELLLEISKEEIAKGATSKPWKEYHYNNANYAMLGAAIVKITGEDNYESACQKEVFKPLGISNAKLNDEWRIMSSWGGWKISARDYLKFIDAHFSQSKFMGNDPFSLPKMHMGDGVNYGLGYTFRKYGNEGINYWHFGLWDWRGNLWDWRRKKRKSQFGAYFVTWENGFALSGNFNVTADWPAFIKLDRELSKAAYNHQ